MKEKEKNRSDSESEGVHGQEQGQGLNMPTTMEPLNIDEEKGKKVVVVEDEEEDKGEDEKKSPLLDLPQMEFMSQRLRSSLILDRVVEYELNHRRLQYPIVVDVRKLRRTLSNRLSAQRSR